MTKQIEREREMGSKWNPSEIMRMMLAVGQLLLILASSSSSQTVSSNCQETCGGVAVPYPFGIGEGCFLNEYFSIRCNVTPPASAPKPYLWNSNIEILNISLDGELRIHTYIGKDCYTESGVRLPHSTAFARLAAFPLSSTKNKFTAIGCDTFGLIEGANGRGFSSGCLSVCTGMEDVKDGACNGIGCCQTSIPDMLLKSNASVGSWNNHTNVWSFNPCSYAFIVEEKSFTFSREDLRGMRNRTLVPSVLDWAVWKETCAEAAKDPATFACKAHSECFDFADVPGYRCNCSSGYEGNPYLGCVDIDECGDPAKNPCDGICHNVEGSYTCSCRKGYHGDGQKGEDAQGCIADRKSSPLVVILVGVGVGIVVLLFTAGFLYLGLKKRKLIRLKEQYFKQNGGLLLQQQLHERDRTTNAAKVFSAEELEKATEHYDQSRIVGRGGFGTVYKGILPNNIVVAIKKSKLVDESQTEQFINEVIVLSQINHRNVVKLLGCCLETEVPLLVYEFVNNGTLFDHIHSPSKSSKMSWEIRLRIASESAGVLSYLHSAASIPIIHRDIKSTNILLDANYTAKVADFGASRLVPLDQDELSTMVQGTLGYLDPEYLHTSQLTEKSDVYSFGVVLVELLTGKKALSFDRPEEERSLAMYFLSALKEDRLFQIVEELIVNEDNEQVRKVANLAKRCLRLKGEERPTMKEVAIELDAIRAMANHPWVSINLNPPEETVHLLGQMTDPIVYADSSTGTTNTGYTDSMKNHVMPSVSSGR
ncbi:putative wall-associated receptor kinase-like 16 [Rhodamnia argentea]|uniref:Wall-associated receptor kinase-like 16 n=1 Tax=Rhodamnia argentea TaxID=178133 RepID=A0ABM3H409_9MYRT|nr:putative wall-associated receptor kinase-like 16 [Rhodamnia argentea]